MVNFALKNYMDRCWIELAFFSLNSELLNLFFVTESLGLGRERLLPQSGQGKPETLKFDVCVRLCAHTNNGMNQYCTTSDLINLKKHILRGG